MDGFVHRQPDTVTENMRNEFAFKHHKYRLNTGACDSFMYQRHSTQSLLTEGDDGLGNVSQISTVPGTMRKKCIFLSTHN